MTKINVFPLHEDSLVLDIYHLVLFPGATLV
jgi:hypothetical protein